MSRFFADHHSHHGYQPGKLRFLDAFAAARRLFQVRAPTARRIKR
jgi:hypothetical protein